MAGCGTAYAGGATYHPSAMHTTTPSARAALVFGALLLGGAIIVIASGASVAWFGSVIVGSLAVTVIVLALSP
jgi:hypothetical protein